MTTTTTDKKIPTYPSVPFLNIDTPSNPPAASRIRVLDLLPGSWDADLQGQLRVVALPSGVTYKSNHNKKCPPYEALSYTWGESKKGRYMYLNDSFRMDITDNLFDALRRLRGRLKRRTLWVDALCINQGDEVEKGKQISLMGNIYYCAMWVNVWLGELDQVLKGPPEDRPKSLWQDRAWIIQEYILAREIYFCVGKERRQLSVGADSGPSSFANFCQDWLKLDWQASEVFVPLGEKVCLLEKQRTRDLWHQDEKGRTVYSRLDQHLQSYWRFRGNSTQTFWHYLSLIESAAAKNPRDLVYCLLGLVKKETAERIGTDYTRPPEVAYARATHALLWDVGIHILAEVWPADESRSPGLPSWAVDFRALKGMDLAMRVDKQEWGARPKTHPSRRG